MLLQLRSPSDRLRIWSDLDGPVDLAPGLAVEWLGRAGHPTSYALLAGRLAPCPPGRIDDPASSTVFAHSLAGRADTVWWGLPSHYRSALVLTDRSPLIVSAAAHGEIGSSRTAFRRLALFLLTCLSEESPPSETRIWTIWADSRADVDDGA